MFSQYTHPYSIQALETMLGLLVAHLQPHQLHRLQVEVKLLEFRSAWFVLVLLLFFFPKARNKEGFDFYISKISHFS